MTNFKVGQSVLCISTCENRLVIKGKQYVIETIIECACGEVLFELVGISHIGWTGTMCNCGAAYDSKALKKSTRFAPIQTQYRSVGISKELAKSFTETLETSEVIKTEKEKQNA